VGHGNDERTEREDGQRSEAHSGRRPRFGAAYGRTALGEHAAAGRQLEPTTSDTASPLGGGRDTRRSSHATLAKLVRDLNPLPSVPDCIEPVGPAPLRALRNPTWAASVAALCGPVRELPAGERPRDWANDGIDNLAGVESRRASEQALHDGHDAPQHDGEALPVGPVPSDLPPVTGPQQYQMQFSTVEEHVHLIERAKALLARENPGVTLGELHLEAMKMFVAALEKRKFAVTDRPRERTRAQLARPGAPCQPAAHEPEQSEAPCRSDAREREPSEAPRQRGAPSPREPSELPLRRSRYIPAAERREVYRRDGGRCCYVDERGERCCETRYLELHHLQPFARQGPNVASNLALRCRAHNTLAAEQDFTPELMAQKRDSLKHESRSSAERP